jgi:hypothetical protein
MENASRSKSPFRPVGKLPLLRKLFSRNWHSLSDFFVKNTSTDFHENTTNGLADFTRLQMDRRTGMVYTQGLYFVP